MKIARWIAISALALLVLAPIGIAGQPKQPGYTDVSQRLREGKPAFTEAQAQSYVREVLPLVEKYSGRKLKTVPTTKLVRRADLLPVLIAEFTPQLKRVYRGWTSQELHDRTSELSDTFAQCCFGKYGVSAHRLYLLPRNFKPLMDLFEVDSKYREQIAKLVIAHELTHAVQDQQLSISKQEAQLDSPEKALAFAATMEGFAMFVQDQVADDLGIDSAGKELARVLSTASINGVDPVAQISAQRTIMREQYSRGRDFIAWQFNKGGIEQVWQVLASPPLATSVVYHPETYSAASTADTDYAAVLKGLEQLLDKRKWAVTNSAVGEMEIRAGYGGMDDKDKEAILPGIERAQSLVAISGQSEIHLALIITKDPSFPPLLISAVERLAKGNFEKLKASKALKLTPFAPSDFNLMKGKADVARRLVYTVSAEGHSCSLSFIRVARGRIMVELCAQQLSIPEAKAAAMFEELFKRLPTKD